MEQLWRITRRLIFLFVTLFVSANAIAYLILNNPIVHDWFRTQANAHLESRGIEVAIGPIALNFLDAKLSFSEIKFAQVGQIDRKILTVENFTIGFDPWRPNAMWIPSVTYVAASDWSLDLMLAKQLLEGRSKDKSQPMLLSDVFDATYDLLGQQLELRNGRVFDKSSLDIRTDLRVNSIFMRFSKSDSPKLITVVAELGASHVCISGGQECLKKFPLESAEVSAELNSEGGVRLERLGARGPYGDWQLGGHVRLTRHAQISNYNLKLEGMAAAAPWFQLADLTGSGRFKANVFLTPGGALNDGGYLDSLAPALGGQVSWSALHMNGFDIYTGSADVEYVERRIKYKNAQIKTPGGAEIDAQGEYDLRGQKPYINTARVRRLSFMELMSGIDVPTEVINFQMTTPELLVAGVLDSGAARGYTLSISGDVDTTEMKVPGFEPNERQLPDCAVRLRINSDKLHMSFAGSSAQCGGEDELDDSDEPSVVSLKKGMLDYSTSRNEFRLVGNALPASLISYFVDEEITGQMNMSGTILSAKGAPVSFTADVQLEAGSVFGLEVDRLGGRIRIDNEGFTATDVEGWLSQDEDQPTVVAQSVIVGFRDKKIALNARVDGKLSDTLRVFGERGRQLAQQTKGRLNISQLRLSGRTDQLSKSNVDLKMRIANLEHPMLSSQDVRAVFSCQRGWCSGSRLFLQNVSIGENALKLSPNNVARNAGLALSKAIFEIDSVSEKSLTARLDIQSIPIRLRLKDGDSISGLFDLRGTLQGGLRDWEVAANGRLDKLMIGSNSIGALALNASSHGGKPLNVFVSGLFDQVQARMMFDHSFQKSTHLFASLRAFEVFKYLPVLNQKSRLLSGDMTAEFGFEGPGLKTLLDHSEDVLTQLSGQGQISKVRMQVGRDSFSLVSPVQMNLSENILTLSALQMAGPSGQLKVKGDYSFANGFYHAGLDAKLNAGILSQLVDVVNQSSGEIRIKGEVENSEDGTSLRGSADIENVSLAGRYLSPPVTSLNGKLVFEDSRIEIPSLTGIKGSGQIEVVGTVDMSSETEDDSFSPDIALRLNMRSAQFRWPQEFFETVETVLDGQVEIVGSGLPYTINGDLKILKGRAYRDATCQELLRSSASGGDTSIAKPQRQTVEMNVNIEADNSFTLQSNCIRGRISTNVKLSGSDVEPILAGQLRLDNGILNLLKTRFDVTRAEAIFDNIVKIEPRLDAQMVAKIEKYSVFVGADGPLSKPRLNIWSDPSVGPDGSPLSRPALIRMISTGRGPTETTQTAVTQAIVNQMAGLFDDPLSQVVSKITRGFVERFELQPIIDGGQSSWRARASRDLGEKFNLGLDYEPNKQSLKGTIFINESVNVEGGFDRRSSQLGSYSELTGGLRFQFGGK